MRQSMVDMTWGGIILALIAAIPGTLALLDRRTARKDRSTVAERRSTIEEYRELLDDCRKECTAIRVEKAASDQRIDGLEQQVRQLQASLSDERKHREFLEHVVRMRGGMPSNEGEST